MSCGVDPIFYGDQCHGTLSGMARTHAGQVPVCRGAYPPTATFAPKDVWLSGWQTGLLWLCVFHWASVLVCFIIDNTAPALDWPR
jgi:hypothetical protein